jgi:hypothetical protein
MDCGFCNKTQRRDNMRRHVRLHVKQASEILNATQIEFCLKAKMPVIVNQNMIACMICGKFEITSAAINQFKRQYQVSHSDCVKCFDSVKKYYFVPSNELVDLNPDADYETKRAEIVAQIKASKESIVANDELNKLKEKYKELEQDWEDAMELAAERKKQLNAYKDLANAMVEILTQCRNEITETVGDAGILLDSIDKVLGDYDELD